MANCYCFCCFVWLLCCSCCCLLLLLLILLLLLLLLLLPSAFVEEGCRFGHPEELALLEVQVAHARHVLSSKAAKGKRVKALCCKVCGVAFHEGNHRRWDGALCTVHKKTRDKDRIASGRLLFRYAQLQQTMTFCKYCRKS